ncbi:aldehyde dehydrogenase [Streptomyces sp. WG-D5]
MLKTTGPEVLHDQILVGGEWVSSAGSEWIEVENPATEEILGLVPDATTEDADRAVAAAQRAYESGPWTLMSPPERAAVLAKVAEGIKARSGELSELYVRDQGGLAAVAPYMGHVAATLVSDFVSRAQTLSVEPEDRETAIGRALIFREPVGPVVAIVPWNSPLILTLVKITPALLAGCPVIVKVSPENPLVSFPLAEIFESAGFPPGVVSFLPGGRALGEYLVAHPAIRHVSFTGSTASGQAVMRSAADNMTRLTLELGGKSAAVVLDDMEPTDFVPRLLSACLQQGGQVCTTQSRILVPRSRHAEFRDAIVDHFRSLPIGDPTDPSTLIGPLISRSQLDRVEHYVRVAKEDGGTIVTGGRRPAHLARGHFYEPTLVDGVTNDMRIAREEVFGPVLCLLTYEDDADAVRIANDTEFGLGNGVHTHDVDRGIALARRLQSGTVSINDSGCILTEPWGGMKKSGLGREGGLEGIEEFLELRQIQLSPFPAS